MTRVESIAYEKEEFDLIMVRGRASRTIDDSITKAPLFFCGAEDGVDGLCAFTFSRSRARHPLTSMNWSGECLTVVAWLQGPAASPLQLNGSIFKTPSQLFHTYTDHFTNIQ